MEIKARFGGHTSLYVYTKTYMHRIRIRRAFDRKTRRSKRDQVLVICSYVIYALPPTADPLGAFEDNFSIIRSYCFSINLPHVQLMLVSYFR